MVHSRRATPSDAADGPVLRVVFWRSASGSEPVRDWLRALGHGDRRAIGGDIKTVQLRWPLGMPLVRKMEPGLWEVRSRIESGIARTFFTVDDGVMVLLHAYVKRSHRTPAGALATARRRLSGLYEE